MVGRGRGRGSAGSERRPYGGGQSSPSRYGGRQDSSSRFDRGTGRGERFPFIFRKKTCRFCGDQINQLDYKNLEVVQKFLTEKGKIIPRRISGACSKHQRMLARAIKRGRHSGLIAFQID
jgi:small subunit ribosomal protein S18